MGRSPGLGQGVSPTTSSPWTHIFTQPEAWAPPGSGLTTGSCADAPSVHTRVSHTWVHLPDLCVCWMGLRPQDEAPPVCPCPSSLSFLLCLSVVLTRTLAKDPALGFGGQVAITVLDLPPVGMGDSAHLSVQC